MAACLLQTLFALNERYIVNEKGALEAAALLPLRLSGLESTLGKVLANPGESSERLLESVESVEELYRNVPG